MKRPIFVRALSDDEREDLVASLRSSDAFVMRRCQILLASSRGKIAREIAADLGCDGQTVRTAINAFNTKGRECLAHWSSRPHTIRPAFDAEQAARLRALRLVWDNASWHISHTVRAWIRTHNRQVKQEKKGVRILPCHLPTKSPWLNPIEPKWIHGQRKIVEPARLLTAREIEDRVCEALGCSHEDHLSISEKVT